jgi:hypothetical protein
MVPITVMISLVLVILFRAIQSDTSNLLNPIMSSHSNISSVTSFLVSDQSHAVTSGLTSDPSRSNHVPIISIRSTFTHLRSSSHHPICQIMFVDPLVSDSIHTFHIMRFGFIITSSIMWSRNPSTSTTQFLTHFIFAIHV